MLTFSATPTVSTNYAIMSWDPSNATAYSSTSDQLTAEKFDGPKAYNAPGLSIPTSVNNSGWFHWSKVLPEPKQQIVNNNVSAGLAGGGWIATSDTNYIVGWIKTCIGSPGTGITGTIVMNVWYDCVFKSRT